MKNKANPFQVLKHKFGIVFVFMQLFAMFEKFRSVSKIRQFNPFTEKTAIIVLCVSTYVDCWIECIHSNSPMPLGFISASFDILRIYPARQLTMQPEQVIVGEFSQGGIGIKSAAVYAEKILDFSPRAYFCGVVERW